MSIEREVDWLEHGVGVRRLDERAVISVAGDDAHDWLQGQITNQLDGKVAGDSAYGFVLTLKGRVLADVWVLVREEDFWLDVPKPQVGALLERLDKYVIMEDVDLEPRDDLAIVTAQGPKAAEIEEGGWPSNRLGADGRQWVVSTDEIDSVLQRLSTRATELGGGLVGDQAWAVAHVLRGRPRFGVDFGEDTYPQETGLTRIAVSFIKGCYIGQETVVMLQNRGKAPKVLWRWEVDAPEPPAPGSKIWQGETEVGEVTSAARFESETLALGYLKRGHDIDGSAGWTVDGRTARPAGPVEDSPGVLSPT
jgi:folate-binding protein YgfZ